jgi:hypothetical protein
MYPISNNYKNLNKAIKGCSILKKDININTYCKHISYKSSNNKGKYNYCNIKGIGKVYFNKLVLLI